MAALHLPGEPVRFEGMNLFSGRWVGGREAMMFDFRKPGACCGRLCESMQANLRYLYCYNDAKDLFTNKQANRNELSSEAENFLPAG